MLAAIVASKTTDLPRAIAHKSNGEFIMYLTLSSVRLSLEILPLGKLDDELPKQRIHSEVKDRLRERAQRAGMKLMDYIRLVLTAKALGSDTLANMHAERIRQVCDGVDVGAVRNVGAGVGHDNHTGIN